jgi:hypothetical protein
MRCSSGPLQRGEAHVGSSRPEEPYYLAYELDALPNSEDNEVNVGEPFRAYNNRIAAPAHPIALPQAGLALDFDDAGRLTGIGGNVTYTGSAFAVSGIPH